MQWTKEDPQLESLIDLFNEQSTKNEWDAAFGTATAIAELYQERSNQMRDGIVMQLRLGVVNRAKQAAEARLLAKKKKK